MKILIAPNAFKGSVTANEAAICIRKGLERSGLVGEFPLLPIADGGDGTLDAFLANGGETSKAHVLDPLGREIVAEFGLLPDGRTAVVEMARASGYALLTEEERNPMLTTSYGTGQLLAAAIAKDCEKIILGVGGSATVDGGAGALQALGMGVFNSDGLPLPVLTGGGLQEIAYIELSTIPPIWQSVSLIIATDVDNPVLGDNGAAAIFGPQKGATPRQVRELELGLEKYFTLIEKQLGVRICNKAGTGAAGALAGSLMAVLGGRIVPGVELLLQHYDFATQLHETDLVITGEGHMDEQTLSGKGPLGIAHLAQQAGVATIALVGGSDLEEGRAREAGFKRIVPITPKTMPLPDALTEAPILLEAAAQQLGKMLKSCSTILL